ncbi:uncharacterized protein BdWA1_004070 [Babesia duncani]|uniref:Uncharacterized protein n=1 Tax=Babesia duncani TaxID=323732 RepID=A0AAD9PGL7_9APIC|nr:hypothetical protein BdWA1_004116 [Babesia duncani]KAK2194415.1 hypothetical protein BdWA1_004118 [Babesia duncani]KAK2194417.1 hypothetical protein BdWA1_004120 [Babesia duncani]KAK2194463.1 hypothetical protein BdWA1_004068 [Babesia duncani]KAK2194465.1 hypothetical protein BdWA1_004070 [Babesia duncani]
MNLKLFTVLLFLGINVHDVISSPQMDKRCNELRQSAISLLFKIHDPKLMVDVNTILKNYSAIEISKEEAKRKESKDEASKERDAFVLSELENFKSRLFSRLENREHGLNYIFVTIDEWIKQRSDLNESQEFHIIQIFKNEEGRLGILDAHQILSDGFYNMRHVTDIKLYDPFMDEFKKYVDSNVTKSEKYLKELEGLGVIKNHPKILAAAKTLIQKYFSYLEHFNKVFEEYRETVIYMEGRSFVETD